MVPGHTSRPRSGDETEYCGDLNVGRALINAWISVPPVAGDREAERAVWTTTVSFQNGERSGKRKTGSRSRRRSTLNSRQVRLPAGFKLPEQPDDRRADLSSRQPAHTSVELTLVGSEFT